MLPSMVGVPVVVRQPNVHEGGVVAKGQEPAIRKDSTLNIEECMAIQKRMKNIILKFVTLHPGLEGCQSSQQFQRICLVEKKT